jgi:Protein of unknown function (DUF1566)
VKRTKVVLLLLAVSAIFGRAQSSRDGRDSWTDPSTGLTWAARDNGKSVSWKGAVKYCQNLRLGGYSDWRLATLDELKGIYDENSNAPGRDGLGAATWHVKGNLFLTGDQWSSNYRSDDRGRNSGYSWFFDFNDGRSSNQPSGFPYSSSFRRALCVRGK